MDHVASKNAPSLSVVLPHFVFGAFVWLVVSLLIILSPGALTQHYFNFGLLSITHLLVLGWITMIMWGALYQLLPVIVEESLHSELLAKISFYLLGSGVIGLSVGFWFGWFATLVSISGGIVLLAVSFFVYNVSKTVVRAKNKGIEQLFVRTAVIWLLTTVFIGVIAALNLVYPFLSASHLQILKLHAHAGMAGWFFLLVMGVASKLFPMFLVVDDLKTGALKLSYFLINSALVIGLVGSYFAWTWIVRLAVIIGVIGLFSFIYFVFMAYKTRMKKNLDIGMRQTIVAFVFLLTGLVFLGGTFFTDLSNSLKTSMAIAYVAAVFIGFFTALTLGQTFKTLPFILWLKYYQEKVGKEKTPMPRDMYNRKIAGAQMALFAMGFILLIVGVTLQNEVYVRISGVVLSLSAVMYCFNILKIIFHKPKDQNAVHLVDQEQDPMTILKQVIDPELMVNIVDLGLVYKVDVDKRSKYILVEMTFSSRGCPLGDAIIENVNQVLGAAYPGYELDIRLVWEPVWNASMISEAGKIELDSKK